MTFPLLQIGQKPNQTIVDIRGGDFRFAVELSGPKYLIQAQRIDTLFEKNPGLILIIIGKTKRNGSVKEFRAKAVREENGTIKEIKIYSRINGGAWTEVTDRNIQEVLEEIYGEPKIPCNVENALYRLNQLVHKKEINLQGAAVDLQVLAGNVKGFSQADIDKTTKAIKNEKDVKITFEKSVDIPADSLFKPSIPLIIELFKQNPNLQIRLGKYLLINENGKITIYEIKDGKNIGKSDKNIIAVLSEEFEGSTYYPNLLEAVLEKIIALKPNADIDPVAVKVMVLKVAGENNQDEVDSNRLDQVITQNNLNLTAKMINIRDVIARYEAATDDQKPAIAYELKLALGTLTKEDREIATPADKTHVMEPAEKIIADNKDAIAAEEKKRAAESKPAPVKARVKPAQTKNKAKRKRAYSTSKGQPNKVTTFEHTIEAFSGYDVNFRKVKGKWVLHINGNKVENVDIEKGLDEEEISIIVDALKKEGIKVNDELISEIRKGMVNGEDSDKGISLKDARMFIATVKKFQKARRLSSFNKAARAYRNAEHFGYLDLDKEIKETNAAEAAIKEKFGITDKTTVAQFRKAIKGNNFLSSVVTAYLKHNPKATVNDLINLLIRLPEASRFSKEIQKEVFGVYIDLPQKFPTKAAWTKDNILAYLDSRMDEIEEVEESETEGSGSTGQASSSRLRRMTAKQLWIEKQKLEKEQKADEKKLEQLAREKGGFFAKKEGKFILQQDGTLELTPAAKNDSSAKDAAQEFVTLSKRIKARQSDLDYIDAKLKSDPKAAPEYKLWAGKYQEVLDDPKASLLAKAHAHLIKADTGLVKEEIAANREKYQAIAKADSKGGEQKAVAAALTETKAKRAESYKQAKKLLEDKYFDKGKLKADVPKEEKAVVLYLYAMAVRDSADKDSMMEANIKYKQLMKEASQYTNDIPEYHPFKKEIIEQTKATAEEIKDWLPGQVEFEAASLELKPEKAAASMGVYMESLEKAIKELEDKSEKTTEDQEKLVKYYKQLSQLYRNSLQYKEALEPANKALELLKKLKEKDKEKYAKDITSLEKYIENTEALSDFYSKRSAAKCAKIAYQSWINEIKQARRTTGKEAYLHKTQAAYHAIELLKLINRQDKDKQDKFVKEFGKIALKEFWEINTNKYLKTPKAKADARGWFKSKESLVKHLEEYFATIKHINRPS